jgi:arsenate reductase (thioredoxin)
MIFQTVIFNRKYAPRGYRAIRPGTRVASQINPLAVQVMKEAGLDIISSQKPKIIRERENMIGSSEKSVNIGCIDKTECPMLFINNVIDWALKTQSAYLLRRTFQGTL